MKKKAQYPTKKTSLDYADGKISRNARKSIWFPTINRARA